MALNFSRKRKGSHSRSDGTFDIATAPEEQLFKKARTSAPDTVPNSPKKPPRVSKFHEFTPPAMSQTPAAPNTLTSMNTPALPEETPASRPSTALKYLSSRSKKFRSTFFPPRKAWRKLQKKSKQQLEPQQNKAPKPAEEESTPQLSEAEAERQEWLRLYAEFRKTIPTHHCGVREPRVKPQTQPEEKRDSGCDVDDVSSPTNMAGSRLTTSTGEPARTFLMDASSEDETVAAWPKAAMTKGKVRKARAARGGAASPDIVVTCTPNGVDIPPIPNVAHVSSRHSFQWPEDCF